MARSPKLTVAQKEEIRKLREESSLSYASIAELYHVSSATIMRLFRPDSYERQLAANRKYQLENSQKINAQRSEQFRHYRFAFHTVNDHDVIEFLDSLDNKQDYIRRMILKDVRKQKRKGV